MVASADGSSPFFNQSKLEPNDGSGQRGVPSTILVIPEGDANPSRKVWEELIEPGETSTNEH
jgi:hypothetical protein